MIEIRITIELTITLRITMGITILKRKMTSGPTVEKHNR
jgi:hypothetical protein